MIVTQPDLSETGDQPHIPRLPLPYAADNPFQVTISSPKPTPEELEAEREADEREEKVKRALESRIRELEERLVGVNLQQTMEAQQEKM